MIGGQLGFKSESTYGTAVTVDTFHEGYLSENPVRQQPPLVSQGQRAGRHTPTVAVAGAKTVSGPFNLELFPAPLAALLTHMFGSVSTTGAGPYEHTATPGDLNDNSFTAQVGIRDVGGTVRPFSYAGTVLRGWTIGATAGQIATLDLDALAQDYVTSTALASASYGSEVPFTFIEGSVSVDGEALSEVNSFNLQTSIPRRVKHPVGSALIMQPKLNGRRSHMITVDTEFEDLTLTDLANTEVAVILQFDNGTEDLTITSNVYVEPSTPTNPGVDGDPTETFTGMALGDTDADTITCVLNNSESTAA